MTRSLRTRQCRRLRDQRDEIKPRQSPEINISWVARLTSNVVHAKTRSREKMIMWDLSPLGGAINLYDANFAWNNRLMPGSSPLSWVSLRAWWWINFSRIVQASLSYVYIPVNLSPCLCTTHGRFWTTASVQLSEVGAVFCFLESEEQCSFVMDNATNQRVTHTAPMR